MTEQEAIRVAIEHIKERNMSATHLDMSIKALEKQIPKKPTMVYPTIASCPICDEIICPHTEYCPDCGQKLDWGNEDAE